MRRHYLTHPRFQFTFTLFFGLGTLLAFLLIGLAVLGGLGLLAFDPAISQRQQGILLSGLSSLTGMWALMGFITLAIFLFVGFYLSYKFVGPLYRLENWLESNIANPSDEHLKLRPGDELEKISNLLHERVQSYAKRRL